MKDKGLNIIIVILVLLIIGVAVYFLFFKEEDEKVMFGLQEEILDEMGIKR